jgi:hypothetical protein
MRRTIKARRGDVMHYTGSVCKAGLGADYGGFSIKSEGWSG